MILDYGVRARIRGVWFRVFSRLSYASKTPARRVFHFFKLLPYRPRFNTKEIVQCVVGDYLFLTHLESSSAPELVMREYGRLSSSIEEDAVILDVGAHVGAFSVMCSKRLNKGLVISFEPNPKIFKLIKINVYLNGLRNVVPMNIALADYCGEAELSVMGDPAAGHLSPDLSGVENFEVQVRTIDDFCLERGIDRVALIKIHAEGSEMDILKGARNILTDNNLNLAISSAHLRSINIQRQICEHLLDLGFKVKIGGQPSHPTLFASKGENIEI